MTKRILSMLLVIIMLITTFPITSVASTELSAAEVVELINDATSYACQASYKIEKNCDWVEPIDFGSLTETLNNVFQAVAVDWTVDSVFSGLYDVGSKTANITNGEESDAINVYDRHFLKSTKLLAEDVESFAVSDNTYTLQLKQSKNTKRDNGNALSRATNDFTTSEDINEYFAQIFGGANGFKIESDASRYENIVLTTKIDDGVVTYLKITYFLSIDIRAKILIVTGSGVGSLQNEIVYTDFNYDNVDLPEILNGWVNENGKWAYYENNIKLKNRWLHDSAGWCYVGADGYCLTNSWVKDSYGWCYLNANGRMVCNNWVYDNGKWYFMDAKGYMVSNCWKKDSNGWCYLGSSGAMLTNAWVRDSVGWCYVGANGYCVTNKWVKDSAGWCYLDNNGRMVYNKWVKDSVGWCYVGSSGYMVYNQWVKYNNQWYYLDANGYMVTGTKVINGKTYKFNSSGVWIG